MLPPKNRKSLITIFGFTLSLLGLLHGLLWETTFNYLLEKELILRPDSKTFDLWTKPPMRVTIDIYLFNWTNPEQFNSKNSKPALQELGPYRFYEVPEKFNLNWHTENASVTYSKRSKFYFDEAASSGSLDDVIVTINAMAVGLSAKSKQWNLMRRAFADWTLNMYHKDVVLRKSVRELLFEGFDDALMNLAHMIPPSLSSIHVPFDKFGYCYPRNKSSFSNTFNVHTGADSIKNFGKLHSWNQREVTNYYNGDCAKVQGTTGEFQPPHLKKNQSLDFFVPDFCRPVSVDYEDSLEVEGLKGYKFIGGDRLVDNGTLYPENKCYCNGDCVPSGQFNISSCWFELPLFVSYPHFYKADPLYLQMVDGMKPQKDLHEMYLIMEPRTSLILDLRARFQANLLVEPISYLSMFRNSRKIFFPLLWFDAQTHVTPDLVEYVNTMSRLILYGQVCGGICFLIGMIIGLWYSVSNNLKHKQMTVTLQNEPLHIYINKKEFTSLLDGTPLFDRVKKSLGSDSSQIVTEANNGNNSWNMNDSNRLANTG